MMELKDKRVMVMGLARSGLSAANLLAERGAMVTVSDIKTEEQLPEQLSALAPGIKYELGGHRLESFFASDLIVISPGVPTDHQCLEEARNKGRKVISEIELAYLLTRVPIIAVTGTNGKTTTVHLVKEILSEGGKKVVLAGNVGYPLSQAIREFSGDYEPDYLVAEISSFQLEGIEHFRPYIGAVLNITPDHLDRHPDFSSYVQLKGRLFLNQGPQDYAVLNYDDPVLQDLPCNILSQKLFFSRRAPVEPGIFLQGQEIIFCYRGEKKIVGSLADLRINGAHNQENALAAILIASICQLEPRPIQRALQNFSGLEHRMEMIRGLKGVKFINDSKGTNVGALRKSLEDLMQPVILIAGGKDKGSDFTALTNLVQQKVKELILLGEAREKIASALYNHTNITKVKDLEEAVLTAWNKAQPGDVILLSPACASFDMFRDYVERGNRFKQLVWAL